MWLTWATLLKREFTIDLEHCPNDGRGPCSTSIRDDLNDRDVSEGSRHAPALNGPYVAIADFRAVQSELPLGIVLASRLVRTATALLRTADTPGDLRGHSGSLGRRCAVA